jgi:hypothetical protein
LSIRVSRMSPAEITKETYQIILPEDIITKADNER